MLATSNARTQTGFKGFDDLNLKNYLNISTDGIFVVRIKYDTLHKYPVNIKPISS